MTVKITRTDENTVTLEAHNYKVYLKYKNSKLIKIHVVGDSTDIVSFTDVPALQALMIALGAQLE